MIDYFDGKLNAGEIAELLAFIDRHADLKEEFEQFDGLELEAENIKFDQKKNLRKTPIFPVGGIEEENYEEFFVAFYEHDLDPSQKKEVTEFVERNPRLEKEFVLHAALALTADRSITYPGKDTLKKKPVVGIYWWAGSVAAALLVLFGIFSLLQQNNEPGERVLLTLNKMDPISSLSVISEKPVANLLDRNEWIVVIPQIEENIVAVEQSSIAFLPSRNVYPTLINLKNYSYYYDYPSGQSDIYYASASTLEKEKKKKGLFAKIVKNYSDRAFLRRSKKENKAKNKEPGFVKLLDQSITVFNTITGSDTELVKTFNEEGNLTFYQVEGETISWSRNISANPNGE